MTNPQLSGLCRAANRKSAAATAKARGKTVRAGVAVGAAAVAAAVAAGIAALMDASQDARVAATVAGRAWPLPTASRSIAAPATSATHSETAIMGSTTPATS